MLSFKTTCENPGAIHSGLLLAFGRGHIKCLQNRRLSLLLFDHGFAPGFRLSQKHIVHDVLQVIRELVDQLVNPHYDSRSLGFALDCLRARNVESYDLSTG